MEQKTSRFAICGWSQLKTHSVMKIRLAQAHGINLAFFHEALVKAERPDLAKRAHITFGVVDFHLPKSPNWTIGKDRFLSVDELDRLTTPKIPGDDRSMPIKEEILYGFGPKYLASVRIAVEAKKAEIAAAKAKTEE